MGQDHVGQPSGTNKSGEQSTGIPSDLEKMEKDQELTDMYTKDDQDIADHIRTNNPNRNVDKEDATNAGGYKN
ncbi:hypothetical protein [Aridibaculum aurantiacum]|uniref:hypothetical protein n=1 Tax=Aridibaculum aurantiacum TaxID=2810307 RepID=UPI001A96B537|nr:hypothetical protein [Aridibaculum aurantiacum]